MQKIPLYLFFEEKNFKSKNYFEIILDELRWCCTSPPVSKRSLQMFLDMYQNHQKGQGITVYHLWLHFSPNWFFRPSTWIHPPTDSSTTRTSQRSCFRLIITPKSMCQRLNTIGMHHGHLCESFCFLGFKSSSSSVDSWGGNPQAIGTIKGHSASPSNNKPITQ